MYRSSCGGRSWNIHRDGGIAVYLFLSSPSGPAEKSPAHVITLHSRDGKTRWKVLFFLNICYIVLRYRFSTRLNLSVSIFLVYSENMYAYEKNMLYFVMDSKGTSCYLSSSKLKLSKLTNCQLENILKINFYGLIWNVKINSIIYFQLGLILS